MIFLLSILQSAFAAVIIELKPTQLHPRTGGLGNLIVAISPHLSFITVSFSFLFRVCYFAFQFCIGSLLFEFCARFSVF